MSTHARIIDRIERAQARTMTCHTCGEPTRLVQRDRSIWLVCSSRDPVPTGFLGTLRLLVPHHEECVIEYVDDAQFVNARRSQLRLV